MTALMSDDEVEAQFNELVNPAPEGPIAPKFEGEIVEEVAAKLRGSAGAELDQVFTVDQVARLVIEVRCVGVDHGVNETTGKLRRTHALKVVDIQPYDWKAAPLHG